MTFLFLDKSACLHAGNGQEVAADFAQESQSTLAEKVRGYKPCKPASVQTAEV
jgi:hypothetical protein